MDQPRPRGRLPKSRRILRRSEYLAVQAGSKRVVTPHFVMLIQARSANRDGAARLGVTASRKVGNAVLRNRAKRLVREAFRATRELWPDGTDVVVIVRGLDRAQRLDDVTAEWLARANEIRRRAHQLRAGQARDSEG